MTFTAFTTPGPTVATRMPGAPVHCHTPSAMKPAAVSCFASTKRMPAASSASTRVSRSEEHTSELQSLMRISYAVFCLKKKNIHERRHSRTGTKEYDIYEHK